MFIILSSTKPKQHSGSTFVLAPFEPCTFHSVICVVEFVCFRVNSCWSLCVHRRCFHHRFCPPPPRRSFHHFSLPYCTPLATFWKVCLGSVTASFVVRQRESIQKRTKKARCQSIQNKKRQGANILNKKGKEGKEKPHHTRQQNYIWGAGLFSCWAPPPFPVLGFGAIFFLISDCLVLERRIPAVVSHPDLGAGLPL